MLARKLTRSGGGVGGGNVASLINGSVASYGSGPRTATVRVGADGVVYTGDNGFFTNNNIWLVSGLPASFEVRCTVISGAVTGTTATWLSLSTTRDWSITDTSNDYNSEVAAILLEIRDAVSLAVLASATWSMEAFRFGIDA